MCWKGYKSCGIKAPKDIKTRKIIILDLKSNEYRPYFLKDSNVRYKVGKTYYANIHPYQIPIEDDNAGDCEIHEGLHSYNWDVPFVKKIKQYITRANGYPKAFYNYAYEQIPVMVECLIPKGTLYYENHQGEIVSEALKIVKIIDVDETGNTIEK